MDVIELATSAVSDGIGRRSVLENPSQINLVLDHVNARNRASVYYSQQNRAREPDFSLKIESGSSHAD